MNLTERILDRLEEARKTTKRKRKSKKSRKKVKVGNQERTGKNTPRGSTENPMRDSDENIDSD